MADTEKNKKLEEHLTNVVLFWNVLDNIHGQDGKHSNVKALAALQAALDLYYADSRIRVKEIKSNGKMD